MDKYIYDDKNGMWYELQGDYYIPCFILPAEKEQPIRTDAPEIEQRTTI